jgi:hypothetical protein
MSSESEARTPPTADELSQAQKVEVYDEEGQTHVLGDLMNGKRTALIFVRHFCMPSKISIAMFHNTDNPRVSKLSSVPEAFERGRSARQFA